MQIHLFSFQLYAIWALRLALGFMAGAFIGMQRAASGKPAGVRTHLFVCMGSTLITLASAYVFTSIDDPVNHNFDPTRIAAQIVSGIGFLGAGSIMREGAGIRGLTTAATLWICAGIGIAFGGGLYGLGIMATALVLIALIYLKRLDWVGRGRRRQPMPLHLVLSKEKGMITDVTRVLREQDIVVNNVRYRMQSDNEQDLEILVQVPHKVSLEAVTERLAALGARLVEWDEFALVEE